jgi:deoxycytidylate deaminase
LPTAPNLSVIGSTDSNDSEKPAEQFRNRESQELIIGFSGPVGSGVNVVADATERLLIQHQYTVVRVKLSDLIVKLAHKQVGNIPAVSIATSSERYRTLQEAGNHLRKEFGNDFLAEVAITAIAKKRGEDIPQETAVKAHIPTKRAYLIDQLKHQDEVQLLRTVYGDLFYLVGVFSSSDQIKHNLMQQADIDEKDAIEIIEKDRKENLEHGQQLEKTLKLADLFIRNHALLNNRIENQLSRFFDLLHGKNGITPTNHEHAMYAAYSAGLRSACLSRQVGASITASTGEILSTGCNDVPQAGGGLYNEHSKADGRCVNRDGGKCYNDYHKNLMRDRIAEILKEELGIDQERAQQVSDAVKKKSGLKDLLEFSRSVHAEMDAITSAARIGGKSIKGAYLYTTTYPCHHCARHIVAAGISKVFYIEPYEKSLARELHRDAIDLDPDTDQDDEDTARKLVQFLHFEGISPRQYQNFFFPKSERKDTLGRAVQVQRGQGTKVIAKLLDDYRDLETKVLTHLSTAAKIPDELFDA